MKIILIRLLSITFLLVGMNACVGPVGPAYGGGGYYDSGYSDGGGYGPTYIVDNDVAYYDTYGHYSSYSRPGYSRYYGRYDHNGHRDSHGYYSRGGRDLRSHSSSSNHYGSHSSPSHSTSSSHQLYTHKSADNNRGAPQGQHTESWYKSRGYGASRLQPASTSNNTSRSNSHTSKKNDDDDHHKHH
ncbi:MAG: hypothetical protein JWO89_3700 [Verrucomicrobiaceae bacterium]|nr:hypothetical protein [Verrucomicrobiaceae bacterium]